ncbi:N-acetylmuramoyl-L-alanine amidase domain [uncultured Caudovirales phage]|uniref:N-acetylmuramoyl-L-alanine amidase n=1 Tax=uncultured Caudovirales phage TaxID=2100421 RepID=A0A6J7WLT7_9CAUD|nr:N-acetylmuramoyl-L-alanine amidase domain [uncultured Caudovirales phage]CAB5217026.1 N-acetylmuramoyl-L-alanine amidase domain [uncultured Caudovirales phage]
MGFKMKYEIKKQYLTIPSNRSSGKPMDKIVFLVAHDTGNPGSTAKNNVDYYERSRDEISASAHIFVDDKEIIECVPFLTDKPLKAWHVLYNVDNDNRLYNANANDSAGGFELCYGGKINLEESYKRYVWVMAYACHVYKLDPMAKITGHYILDPKRKTDPQLSLKLLNKTLNDLIKDVSKELKDCMS